jgi:hypothetical protein
VLIGSVGHVNTTEIMRGLVVRVPGYRSGGPGFDFRRYQMLCEVVGVERGPHSFVRTGLLVLHGTHIQLILP